MQNELSIEENKVINNEESVSYRAYELLRPFAQLNDITSIVEPAFVNIGTHEGVALLLIATQLDSSAMITKKADSVNYDHATLEATRIVDNLMGFFSTALVVLTLSFSISFMILQIITTTFSASIGPLGGGIPFFEKWERYDDFLFVCHWIECILLVSSIYNAYRGIILGFLLYCSLAIYMTELEDKITFLMDHLTKLCDTWIYTGMSITCLLLSLPFVGARTSPVFCLTSCLLFIGFCISQVEGYSIGVKLAKQQLKRAKAIIS